MGNSIDKSKTVSGNDQTINIGLLVGDIQSKTSWLVILVVMVLIGLLILKMCHCCNLYHKYMGRGQRPGDHVIYSRVPLPAPTPHVYDTA